MLSAIRSERGTSGATNDAVGDDENDNVPSAPRHLSGNELQPLLEKRVSQMREGGGDASPTDQYRVYMHIIGQFQSGEPLRLMIQASAGTGKSYSLPPLRLLEACFTNCLGCHLITCYFCFSVMVSF